MNIKKYIKRITGLVKTIEENYGIIIKYLCTYVFSLIVFCIGIFCCLKWFDYKLLIVILLFLYANNLSTIKPHEPDN